MFPKDNGFWSCGKAANLWSVVYSSNGTIQTSDKRLKNVLGGVDDGLAKVLEMKPVKFAWKKDSDQTAKYGFLAQELLDVVPEVVDVPKEEGAYMGVNYAELVPVLVKAVQELTARVAELEEAMQ